MLYIAGGSRPRSVTIGQEKRENIFRKFVLANDEKTISDIVNFIVLERPVAIHASASSLPPIIDYLRSKKIAPNSLSVRSVITGGVMVPEKLCDDLRGCFGENLTIGVKYSNEELGIMAMKTDGEYVWNHADYFVEILKQDSDAPCELGEFGRIVVTDLYNFAISIIRYDTGDMGTLIAGRNGWPELTNLSGKRRDLIFNTHGDSISGVTITNLMKYSRNVRMWQLVQEGAKRFRYKIVPEKSVMPSESDIRLDELRGLLGTDGEIIVEYVDDIPVVNSGKRRYTVSLYKPQ